MRPIKRKTRQLVALASALVVSACFGDMVSTQPAGERFEGVPIDPTRELTCIDPIDTTDDGHHYEGMACTGCHNGTTAVEFTSGGTLYADPGGSMPLSGFSVSIIDSDDTQIDAVSGLNGNFYTSTPLVFPAIAYVSACPDSVPMPIQLTVGDCNGCHVAGDRITFSP